MVTEGIVLGHKIYAIGLEVDQAKVYVIETLMATYYNQRDKNFFGTC